MVGRIIARHNEVTSHGLSDRREAVTTRLAKGVAPCWIPQEGENRSEEGVMSGAETGAKKRSENRQKQERLTVRFSPTEREQLEALADREGLTLGSYIRSRSLETPTTRARRRPTLEVQAVKALLGQVGKVGGNLHQLLKRVNFGDTPLTADLHATLAEIRQTAKLICDKLDGNT